VCVSVCLCVCVSVCLCVRCANGITSKYLTHTEVRKLPKSRIEVRPTAIHHAPTTVAMRSNYGPIVVGTSAYGASPVLVSRASRSAVASFSQLEADRKVTT